MAKYTRFSPVALLWVDAAFHATDGEDLFPIPAITFGIIWEETEEYIKIASEIFADGVARTFVTVPKNGGMGPKILKLGKMKVPDNFIEYQNRMIAFLDL